PLDALRARLPRDLALGVKLAPAVSWDELAAYDAEAEFISVGGELKECVLWIGPLRTAGRRATVLPGRHTLTAGSPAPAPPARRGAAVVRRRRAPTPRERLGAPAADAEPASLAAGGHRPTPSAAAYHIDGAHTSPLRRLGERLRALPVGHVPVTKRGSAVDPA